MAISELSELSKLPTLDEAHQMKSPGSKEIQAESFPEISDGQRVKYGMDLQRRLDRESVERASKASK